MTQENSQLTQEQKTELIARIVPGVWKGDTDWLLVFDNGKKREVIVFDPFNDLNAAFKMEDVLTYDQREEYARYLYGAEWVTDALHDFDGETKYETVFQIAHATGAQRVEAFGKTLNLW